MVATAIFRCGFAEASDAPSAFEVSCIVYSCPALPWNSPSMRTSLSESVEILGWSSELPDFNFWPEEESVQEMARAEGASLQLAGFSSIAMRQRRIAGGKDFSASIPIW